MDLFVEEVKSGSRYCNSGSCLQWEECEKVGQVSRVRILRMCLVYWAELGGRVNGKKKDLASITLLNKEEVSEY